MTEISDLISSIQNSGLDAECPECEETSALSSWILFDGTKPFPTDAEQKRQEMEKEHQLLREELKKKNQKHWQIKNKCCWYWHR